MIEKCPLCSSKNTIIFKDICSKEIIKEWIYNDFYLDKCNDCNHIYKYYNHETAFFLEKYYREDYIKNHNFCKNKNNYWVSGIKFNDSKAIRQEYLGDWILELIDINTTYRIYPLRDFIILDQTLEHCWDIKKVINHLKMSLIDNGYLYISVPNAEKYNNDYFWLIKEHLHHFNKKNVIKLFEDSGFKLIKYKDSKLKLCNGKLKMPNMEFLFQKTEKQKDKITGTYCYGAGRELSYLLANDFKDIKIDGIIDDKKYNEEIYKSEDIIPLLSNKSKIIITSSFYHKEIKKKIKKLGFKGKIKKCPKIKL